MSSPYQLLPALRSDELQELERSIREEGFDEAYPVVVDEEGNILDGHHRAAIAERLGIEYPLVIKSGLAEHEKRLFSVERNISRRHLIDSQKVLLGKRIEPDIEERARLRQIELAGTRPNADLGDSCHQGRAPRSVDEVARNVNIGSGRTYDRARDVLDKAEDMLGSEEALVELVDAGLMIRDLKRMVKEHEREQKRETNRALVEQAPVLNSHTDGRTYQTIVLDPPWDWGDEGDVDQYGRARPVYDTMSIDKVAALPIADLADKNAHIYLWITNRSLPKGFALLEAWGFRYVTMLTWAKPSIGMGNYFRGSTEQILFGVRGSLPLLRNDVGTWFEAPRAGQHSAKPDAFYGLVEVCSPGPWLELFARRERPGWVHWGAEV